MSLDHVVVDIEIAKTIEETPGGWDATDKLGVAVACLWEYRTDRMRVYGPDDVPALRDRLLKADRISTYNGVRFDYPVIWGISKQNWYPGRAEYDQLLSKSDDMLRRIWRALGLNPDSFGPNHKGWGLDAVACATLNCGKIGFGGDAPKWYQAGQIQRVVNYCCDDVCLERDLCDFIERYGYVLNDAREHVNVTRGRLHVPPWKPETP